MEIHGWGNVGQAGSSQAVTDSTTTGHLSDPKLSTSHVVTDLKKEEAQLDEYRKKHQEGKYVPPHIAKQLGIYGTSSNKIKLQEAMAKGESCFAKGAKPAKMENLGGIRPAKEKQPFPKSSLTRMISGDVRPEWLTGLGRMQADKVTPAAGYKDVFVSSIEEYEKKGIHFDPVGSNDAGTMAEKLDLKGDDLAKIQSEGAWLIQIHPGSKLAVPTERKNEWNPGYVEGGYTGSNQQEWVTPNVGLDQAVRSGQAKIFKIDNEGNTVQWKFFKGDLLPQDKWEKAIQDHVSSVANPEFQKDM